MRRGSVIPVVMVALAVAACGGGAPAPAAAPRRGAAPAAPSDPIAGLVQGLASGQVDVVDLAQPLNADDADHSSAAAVREHARVQEPRDLQLRRQGPGVVLELDRDRRARRHAFRRAVSLGDRQGQGVRRCDRGAAVRRPGRRDRRDGRSGQERRLHPDAAGDSRVGEDARPHSERRLGHPAHRAGAAAAPTPRRSSTPAPTAARTIRASARTRRRSSRPSATFSASAPKRSAPMRRSARRRRRRSRIIRSCTAPASSA